MCVMGRVHYILYYVFKLPKESSDQVQVLTAQGGVSRGGVKVDPQGQQHINRDLLVTHLLSHPKVVGE